VRQHLLRVGRETFTSHVKTSDDRQPSYWRIVAHHIHYSNRE
jgi:hypothetical protein